MNLKQTLMQTKKQYKTSNRVVSKQNSPNLFWLCSVIFACSIIFLNHNCSSQDSTRFRSNRLRNLVIVTSIGYTAGMTGLYHLWYRDAEQQSFRFFNDNKEWKQVDKIGHFGSSFYMS